MSMFVQKGKTSNTIGGRRDVAAYAVKMKRKRRGKAAIQALYAAGGLAVAALALTAIKTTNAEGALLYILAALIFAGLIYGTYSAMRAKESLNAAGKAKVGARSEKLAYRKLLKLGLPVAAFGVVPKGYRADIDAIAVTKTLGLAAIEVKTAKGVIKPNYKGLTSNGRQMHGNPPAQAVQSAERLEEAIPGVEATPIVLIPEAQTKFLTTEHNGRTVYVCSTKGLGYALKHCPPAGFKNTGEADKLIQKVARKKNTRR